MDAKSKCLCDVISTQTLLLTVGLGLSLGSSAVRGDVGLAFEHIYEVMDTYHEAFDVYTDLSAAGNHFVVFAQLSSAGGQEKVMIDPGSEVSPHSGTTCVENRFVAAGDNWGGYYFMNGVLDAQESQPRENWGDDPNAGMDLTGATQLAFWARGQNGGERVEFFAFGVGRNPDTGAPITLHPDSSPKKTLGYVTLSNVWTRYAIDLVGADLSYVLGGFAWVTNASNNSNRDVTFYLDDIRYDKARLDDPRFLVSYETVSSADGFDVHMKNVAFTYDNALVLLALLCRSEPEDLERAGLLADALVYAIDHDRAFDDGRLRNAYQGGDLWLSPGWTPNGRENTVRMPGWVDPNSSQWTENEGHVGTHTGNMGWAIIALVEHYERTGGSQHLDCAVGLGEWIEAETRDTRGAGGYTGGYDGWEPTPGGPQGQTEISWKSTENNIDVYVAFMRLFEATGNTIWQERALHARGFVEAMWNDAGGHFWTGTLEDGVALNTDTIPVDVQAWAISAFGDYTSAIEWSEQNCYVEVDGFEGFDFNGDKDGVWFEGTAHMALAYQIDQRPVKSGKFVQELRRAQMFGDHSNGKGMIAASHDGVSTGFGGAYFSRLHVGATAWYAFAELGYNPFWGTQTPSRPLPCDLNWDGITTIVGDVLPFVKVIYSGDTEWYAQQFPGKDPDYPADANADGLLSIVGDVPPFVDCVYRGDCP